MSEQSRAYVMLDRLRTAQLRLAALALMVMMCVTVVDVFLRYAFNRPIPGSYDLVEVTLVFFVFHGMSTAFLQRRSIVIDLIDTFAGRRLVAALIRFSDVLTIVALGLFAWAMLGPALQAYEYGDRKLELNLPIYLLWVVALAGMAGAILCAFGALIGRAAAPHGDPGG
jgi:TRAP-type C4-dicarboxylate transport system permease small subunit